MTAPPPHTEVFWAQTKANLAAVVINSKTLPEFNRVVQDCRNSIP